MPGGLGSESCVSETLGGVGAASSDGRLQGTERMGVFILRRTFQKEGPELGSAEC